MNAAISKTPEVIDAANCLSCGSGSIEIRIDNLFQRTDNPLFVMTPDYAVTGRIFSIRCKDCGNQQSHKMGSGNKI